MRIGTAVVTKRRLDFGPFSIPANTRGEIVATDSTDRFPRGLLTVDFGIDRRVIVSRRDVDSAR